MLGAALGITGLILFVMGFGLRSLQGLTHGRTPKGEKAVAFGLLAIGFALIGTCVAL